MRPRRSPVCAACLLALLATGCRLGPEAGEPLKNEPLRGLGEQTLYQQLHGEPGIAAIVDNWLDRGLKDPQVNFIRRGHPHAWSDTPDHLAQLKIYLTQYLGMLADGPQVYEGRNILLAHSGMDISEGEWLAFLQDLKRALDELRVPADQQKALIARVAATHPAIVNR